MAKKSQMESRWWGHRVSFFLFWVWVWVCIFFYL